MDRTAIVSVLEEFNKPLQIREMKIPELKPGQILVKITAAGVCGSDVHMYEGRDPRLALPMCLGHEGVGQIVEMSGEKQTPLGEKINEGDMVIWNRGVLCGDCYYCTISRQPSLCVNRWAYGIHRSVKIPPHLNGCYADHLILHEKTDIFLLDDRDSAVYVPASCSGATAAHAFEYARPKLKTGDTVLIQGPGSLGIFLVAYAKASGAGRIIVTGGTQSRLDMCLEFGATDIINRHNHTPEETKEIVLSITHGFGVDVALEASGSLGAVTDGMPLVRTGGAYITAGFGEPAGSVEFPWFENIVRKNVNLQGVWVSDTRHVLEAVRTVQMNYENFAKIITHRFSLEESTEALESVASREAVKAVLIPPNKKFMSVKALTLPV
ncbi:alcohol dehydrogenase catalytic domain-containing protein [Candidatus Poribacteria bacterium]|nr:alcohol dehydrogenase catalytic domain-containing protein [Candidatus Poribacteria bacterium]